MPAPDPCPVPSTGRSRSRVRVVAVLLAVLVPVVALGLALADAGRDRQARAETVGLATAGWYSGGVRPGDPGPAIIAGHVDSYRGPAVFSRLDRLTAGDTAVVTRADGTRLTFVVESAARYPKADFPTSEVYGPTPTPVLELITCTGVFDRAARSHEDNLVVTTTLRSGA